MHKMLMSEQIYNCSVINIEKIERIGVFDEVMIVNEMNKIGQI